jgi:hypothetical protein
MCKMYVYIANIRYIYHILYAHRYYVQQEKKITTVILSVARESFVQLFLEIL